VRAGDILRYEKLVMDISTNGACSPRVALDKAIALLMDNIGKIAKLRTVFDQDAEKNSQEDGCDKFHYNPNVFRLLEDLEISVRSLNALRSMGCSYIGDLAILSEDKILSTPNLGRKSSDEIENILEENGLTYETEMPWINDGSLSQADFERLSLQAQEYAKKKGDDSKLSPEDYIY
jgi:DNA-directed RNA polymerase subunit alpha